MHSFLSGGGWLDVAALLVILGMLPDGLLAQTVGAHIERKWGVGHPSRRYLRALHDPVILATVSAVEGDLSWWCTFWLGIFRSTAFLDLALSLFCILLE